MDDKFEKLTSGEFFTQDELAEILGCAKQNNAKNIKTIAKKYDRAIEYKSCVTNGRYGVLLRLSSNAKYQEQRICLDDYLESKITSAEFVAMIFNFGNRQHDIAECLFENSHKYLSYDEVSELTGLSACGVPGLVKNLIASGFNIHTRGYREDREVKLIGITKPRNKLKVKQVRRISAHNLINEVFCL